MAVDKRATGLAVMRIGVGVFFVAVALNKLSWLTSSAPLSSVLDGWLRTAGPLNRWYLEHVAIPWSWVLARAVALGEFSCGLALVVGFWTRTSALVAFLMVLNFHFASGLLVQRGLFTAPQALPLLAALFALALGGARLPLGVSK